MCLALMKSITLTEHPELYRLLKDGESLADFLELSPSEILLRWLNCELKNAGSSRMATKFTKDFSAPEILTTVLKHIEPECCTPAPRPAHQRAHRVSRPIASAGAAHPPTNTSAVRSDLSAKCSLANTSCNHPRASAIPVHLPSQRIGRGTALACGHTR
jgi:hypothetical protein